MVNSICFTVLSTKILSDFSASMFSTWFCRFDQDFAEQLFCNTSFTNLDRREAVSCIWSTVYVSQYLSTKTLSDFSTSIFSTWFCRFDQHFAEQLFCETSFTDCVWFIWLPFRWLRTGIYILITKYILRKWRSYFSCISFIFFLSLTKAGQALFDDYKPLSAH